VEGNRQERQVAVPGALLAVRGTRYGVEVDKAGRSTLVVFEGVVEVLPKVPHTEPIRVKAGEWATFGPNRAPQVQPMSMRGFEERTWNQGMRPDGTMGPGVMSQENKVKGMPSGGPMHR
jgi:ferric-dicitrate binding protein FerR (iron transport regulator)